VVDSDHELVVAASTVAAIVRPCLGCSHYDGQGGRAVDSQVLGDDPNTLVARSITKRAWQGPGEKARYARAPNAITTKTRPVVNSTVAADDDSRPTLLGVHVAANLKEKTCRSLILSMCLLSATRESMGASAFDKSCPRPST
jgi:hypothetical protein